MSKYVTLSLRMSTSKPDKTMEKVILNLDWDWTAASKAVEYCRKILKKRWPAAENKIKKIPYMSYMYARHVVKGRWKEAEPIIAKEGRAAYLYAKFVLKDRFFPAEKNKIWNCPNDIYLYSKYILKSRWLEKEKHFEKMVNDTAGYNYWALEGTVKYHIQIRKIRWPQIENAVVQSGFIGDYYNSLKNESDKEEFYNKILAESLVEVDKWQRNHALDFIKNKK